MSDETKSRREAGAATGVPPVWAGVVLGSIVTGAALATGHLLAALMNPNASPVIAVGSAAIDATPEWLKSFAIRTFGTHDKTALLSGIGLVLVLASVLLGIAARRRTWIGFVGLGALTTIGTAAALTRPAANASWSVPALAAGAVAAAAFVLLHRATRISNVASSRVDAAAPLTPLGFDRRRFLASAAALAAAALAGGGIAQRLGRDAVVAAARGDLSIPRPQSPAPPLAPGVDLDVAGASSFTTPVARFYRVDTALIVPKIRLEDWRLQIGGMVDRPATLTFEDLIAGPLIERDITLNCVSNEVGGRYIGTQRWIGAALRPLLEEAGIQPGATQIASRSEDGFTAATPLVTALDGRDAMLAVAMEGEPLPFEHGFPVRMLVPGLYGYESATKWVTRLDLVDDSYRAYWVKRGWAKAVDVKTASRIDTPGRGDELPAGTIDIAGVAWAQHRGIHEVEVQIDAGPWSPAELADEGTIDTWRLWRYRWDAPSGVHTIRARATDGTGAVQDGTDRSPFPSGATGYDVTTVRIL